MLVAEDEQTIEEAERASKAAEAKSRSTRLDAAPQQHSPASALGLRQSGQAFLAPGSAIQQLSTSPRPCRPTLSCMSVSMGPCTHARLCSRPRARGDDAARPHDHRRDSSDGPDSVDPGRADRAAAHPAGRAGPTGDSSGADRR